jgi:hypothetical protein
MANPKVQKLREKRQALRAKRRGLKQNAAPDEAQSSAYVGPDVATTSYLRAQGKAYAKGRTARAGTRMGDASKAGPRKVNDDVDANRPSGSVRNINRRIKAIDKKIARAKSK